jgi:hypothetical protein
MVQNTQDAVMVYIYLPNKKKPALSVKNKTL